ncbi:HNH endonuclease [Nocardia sp. NPDC020380]|uniref:HNH endonuclease n=1 Tax=Nocardia sp. NPDC020380 TaxID=3364309 RepID=UPI00379D0979
MSWKAPIRSATQKPVSSKQRRDIDHSRLRRERRKLEKRLPAPCAWCGKTVEPGIDYRDPMAFELDHIIPVSLGGDPFDPNNHQIMHKSCNASKGNRTDKMPPLRASREW